MEAMVSGRQVAPGRAEIERYVADIVGTNDAHQATVWQAIGMLKELYGLEERAALTYLSQCAARRDLELPELAALLVSREEPP